MRRTPSGFISVVVPSALLAYWILAVARERVAREGRAKSGPRRDRAGGRTRPGRGESGEHVRVRPNTRPQPAVDLRPEPVAAPGPPAGGGTSEPRRRRTRLALFLIVGGAIVASYATTVVVWRDPLTDLYARWKQAQAEDALGATFAQFDEPPVPASSASRASAYAIDPDAYARAESVAVARAARRMMAGIRLGQPVGRIAIPTLGVKAVFVHGTRWGPDLSRGPGHYKETPLPGVGKTSAIAAHRTTFGAWFRHIDELRRGHRITISLPYATFEYKVFNHKIVDDRDWSIIENRGFDALVLSACHPLYSAAQRWVVFARLTSVKPRDGEPYAVTAEGEPVALQKT